MKETTIYLVRHGRTEWNLEKIMAHFNNQEIHEIWDTSDMEAASLCKVSVKDGIAKILLHGDTSHYR